MGGTDEQAPATLLRIGPMSARLEHLFEPIRIGAMELRNRLVMSPMETQYGAPGGIPTQRTIDYYVERAKGGVGLITLGACSIDEQHVEVPASLHFASDDGVPVHRDLVDAVHEHGAKIQPQLAHAGPDGLGPEMHGAIALGPSAIQSYLTQTTSKELSLEEFERVVDLYKAAAVRIREAGYDGLELHAAHGYMLLGSFMTPWRNARKDEFSGRKPEGRIRAVTTVLRAIKAEVGAEFPITLRVSGFERIAGGRPSFDTQRVAPDLVEAGVDAFHVSGGVIDRFVTQMVNGAHYRDGLNVAAAAAVKRVVDVPVIVVGRIHDPEFAEKILAEGHADLVAMGRPLLADPELPTKAAAGRFAEIRRCISCQNCIDAMELRGAMDCAVNPRTGREAELRVVRAETSKRVVVIGAGPAGLEAARVAAQRGHRVSLHERNGHLGGALVAAATVHAENQPILDHLIAGIRKSGVSLHLHASMTPRDVAALSPDAVIVATGARIESPEIPGLDLPHVYTGRMLRATLGGRIAEDAERELPAWQRVAIRALGGRAQRWVRPPLIRTAASVYLPIGRRVVVVGADLAAIELAEFLAARGRDVGLLEPAERIAPEVGPKRRMELMESLDRAGVALNTGVRILRIERGGVVIRVGEGEHLARADHVIVAGEAREDTTLADALTAEGLAVQAVGDCTGLGLIQKAILEGARAACAI